MGGRVIDSEMAVKLADIFLHTEFEATDTSIDLLLLKKLRMAKKFKTILY